MSSAQQRNAEQLLLLSTTSCASNGTLLSTSSRLCTSLKTISCPYTLVKYSCSALTMQSPAPGTYRFREPVVASKLFFSFDEKSKLQPDFSAQVAHVRFDLAGSMHMAVDSSRAFTFHLKLFVLFEL